MRKSLTIPFLAVAFAASVAQLIAGGLFVVVGNPEASPEARAKNAVLTLKAAGCHQPEKTIVTGEAVGLVDGHQRSIPLDIIALAEPGSFAITRQWPSSGRWVLQFVGREGGRVTTTLVAVGPNGVERNTAKYEMREPSKANVAAMLAHTSEVALK